MKSIKWLAFGCSHAPLHDPAHIDWIEGRIREVKPDVVLHLGDLHEADSASRWPSEYDWDLTHEFREADRLLNRIRTAAQAVNAKARCVFLPGNHDANLLAMARIPRKVRLCCDWRVPQYDADKKLVNGELLKHWRTGCAYRYCRTSGVYRIGQVTFAHGYEHGVSGDEAQSILLGQPYGLYVSAHTHRPQPVTQAMRTRQIPLPYWFANVGCSREMKPAYVERRRTHQWGQAVAYGDAELLKSPRAGRRWSATVEIFRMYDAWAGR